MGKRFAVQEADIQVNSRAERLLTAPIVPALGLLIVAAVLVVYSLVKRND